MSNTFLFTYGDMRLGGVQQIVYNNIRIYLDKGWRVIWLAPGHYEVETGYRRLVNRETITILPRSGGMADLAQQIFDGQEQVVMVAFDFDSYLLNTRIAAMRTDAAVNNFFVVPNVLGDGVAIDKGSEEDHAWLAPVYGRLYAQGRILFCNVAQRDAFVAHYGIDPADGGRIIPPHRYIPPFDEAACKVRFANREILTVARFEFPHKGYIIGLIDAFGQLRVKNPGLRLKLIGYGAGEAEVQEHIRSLGDEAAQAVTVVGAVSFDELPTHFAQAKVFVGVAGALSDAVAYGLPGLIARHYTQDCETYGLYQQCPEKLICEEPGQPVIPAVQAVLDADEAAYVRMCHDGWDALASQWDDPQRSPFEMRRQTGDGLTAAEIERGREVCARHLKARKGMIYRRYLKDPLYLIKRLLKKIRQSR